MEVLRLRREDVDLAGRRMRVRIGKAGARYCAMTEDLADFPAEYLDSLPKDSPWLFPSSRSAFGHRTTMRSKFRTVIRAAWLDPDVVVRHTLRHTAISHFRAGGRSHGAEIFRAWDVGHAPAIRTRRLSPRRGSTRGALQRGRMKPTCVSRLHQNCTNEKGLPSEGRASLCFNGGQGRN